MYQFLLQWLYLIIIIPAIWESAIDTWKPQETDNQPVVNWLIQTLRFYILYLAFNIVCLWAQYAAGCDCSIAARRYLLNLYAWIILVSSAGLGLLAIRGLRLVLVMNPPKSDEFAQALTFVLFVLCINGSVLWLVGFYFGFKIL